MREPAPFRRLRTADVAVLHDDVPETYWWLLRSLPALRYLEFSTFTYPTSWRTLNTGGQFQSYENQFDYLDYDYKVLGELEEAAMDGDLVVHTNSYYETETEHSVSHLVSRYAARDETLVVVTDSPRFTPRGGQRPLYQEQFAERIGTYQRLYEAYEDLYDAAGWSLPLLDTKNLFLHDNANLYEHVSGESVQTAKELFEVLPSAPYLPLYEMFGAVFAREDEFGTIPLDEDDVTGLQRWLRRRIEWDRGTATEVAQLLNREVSKEGQTFDPSYAARSPAVHDARSTAKTIDPDKSSIHMRYRTWLQRHDP